jgi:hypothetical protein
MKKCVMSKILINNYKIQNIFLLLLRACELNIYYWVCAQLL